MEEKTSLTLVKESANKILAHEVVERHSLFQLQCFVLAKEPTIQGKLQQCLREIKARNQSLDALSLEIEEQKDKLEIIDLDISEMPEKEINNKRSEKLKDIKLRSMNRQRKAITNSLKELEKKEKDIIVELQFFCSAFDQLNKKEKLKPWDDPDVQKEYWSEKLRLEVNYRLLIRQLPDIELLRTILCLHDDSPIKTGVLKMLRESNEKAAALAQK
jgi:chromosome segregation ATPase